VVLECGSGDDPGQRVRSLSHRFSQVRASGSQRTSIREKAVHLLLVEQILLLELVDGEPTRVPLRPTTIDDAQGRYSLCVDVNGAARIVEESA
jgi:hypothetical protein